MNCFLLPFPSVRENLSTPSEGEQEALHTDSYIIPKIAPWVKWFWRKNVISVLWIPFTDSFGAFRPNSWIFAENTLDKSAPMRYNNIVVIKEGYVRIS